MMSHSSSASEANPGPDPFFIVGAGRSGTTLLRLMLTGHTRLHIPPETWFLRPLVQNFPLIDGLTQSQAERAAEIMVRHERWPDMGMDAAVLRQQAAGLAEPRLGDLIGLVHRHLLAASGKPRIGDKTPHYFAIVPELAVLYPRAKFIYLVRDGHDVAMSWIDAGWQWYYEQGFEWVAAMRSLRRDRAAYPGRVLEVRYEDLVRQPADVLRAICDFLGETFETGMLDWRRRLGSIAPRDRHLHGRLQQPLAAESVAMWRVRLSPAECFAMEACLYRDLVQHGYQLRFAARAWRPALGMAGMTLRALAPALRLAMPWLQRRGLLRRPLSPAGGAAAGPGAL